MYFILYKLFTSKCALKVFYWLIHVNVWQKTLQYCKVISFQLIKINEKKQKQKKKKKIKKEKA